MGTYELSDYENEKPTWSSLSAAIWFDKNKYWNIGDIRKRGAYIGVLTSWVTAEWPTQSKNIWRFLTKDNVWSSVDEDISVKCTGNT